MASLYCANVACGSKNDYLGVKPRCCNMCGTPFDAAFKRPTPVFVAPAAAPAPVVQQPPQRHVGSYYQQPPYAPGLQDIVASDIQLDPSLIHVESDRPQKVTMESAIRMGKTEGSARVARAEVNPEGHRKSMGSWQDEQFNQMRQGVPDRSAQAASAPTPVRSPSRSRKKSS